MQVTPATVWQSWSLSPWTLAPLALVLAAGPLLHGAGIRDAASRLAAPPRLWFTLGWLALALALISPLCRMAATLVSAHMVQHLTLVIVAPALLAMSLRFNARPDLTLPATFAYGMAIWIWHAPPVYAAIVTHPTAHLLGYLLLIGAACCFWFQVLRANEERRGVAAMALAATALHTTLLGALLTFSPNVFYPVLAAGAPAWGMDALQDQQLAGLIMWVPGGVAYAGLALWLSLAAMGLRTAHD
jgi:putative membrane protein